MLEITDLHVYYGEIHALKGISFQVAQGEIVTLLGNNGAGKTTTLRTLSGLLSARHGDVRFEGTSLVGIPPHEVVLKEARTMARLAADQDDAGTHDLIVSGVIRLNEHQAWVVAAHAVDVPEVRM